MKRLPIISLSVVALTLPLILLATIGSAAKQNKALTAAPSSTTVAAPGAPQQIGPTVNAVQSGPWNVGITGTPTFNLNNSDSSPLFVRDVDRAAREPFQEIRSVRPGETGCGQNFCTFNLGVVPDGKALIITNFHGEILALANQTPGPISLLTTIAGSQRTVFSVPRDGVTCANDNLSVLTPSRCPFNQQLHLTIDAGHSLIIDNDLTGSYANTPQLFVVSGYYVDAPATAASTQQRMTSSDQPGGATRREIQP